MMFTHLVAARALELLHDLDNAKLPCSLQENVDVVWSALDSADVDAELLRRLNKVRNRQLPR